LNTFSSFYPLLFLPFSSSFSLLSILTSLRNVSSLWGSLHTVVLISDGKGNVFIKNNLEEDIKFLSEFASNINLVIVNAEIRNRSIGILEDIAKIFNASHFYLEDVI